MNKAMQFLTALTLVTGIGTAWAADPVAAPDKSAMDKMKKEEGGMKGDMKGGAGEMKGAMQGDMDDKQMQQMHAHMKQMHEQMHDSKTVMPTATIPPKAEDHTAHHAKDEQGAVDKK